MEVVFRNQSQPKEFKHKCDVCGQRFNWSEESGYYEKAVGKGYRGYEIEFIICSEACRNDPGTNKLVEKFYKYAK